MVIKNFVTIKLVRKIKLLTTKEPFDYKVCMVPQPKETNFHLNTSHTK